MNEKFGNPGIINDDCLRKMLNSIKLDVDASRNSIYEEDNSPKVLKSLGIDIANGRAYFQDAHLVNVQNEVVGTNTKIFA
jgi:pyruvate/2-oxoglutarate dehydrogenase complex dihydrolipoamide dehydrogenase (E3) component